MSAKRSAVTIAASVAGGTAALYALLMAAALFGQRALIYPAPMSPVEPRADGATLERIAGADGAVVYALYAPSPPGSPTIVHFHGNGEDLAHQAWLVEAFRRTGIGVLAVEYPGYGLAKRDSVSEAAIYAAAEAALRHLYALGVARDSIILEGQSLGTGVAVEMAHRGHGSRLILISPYTSMLEMAARVTPFLPVRWLLRDRYDTERKVSTIATPALIIHGTEDEVVPFEMGKRVAALLPKCEFLPVEGAHHNDLFDLDEHGLVAKIAAFARGVTPRAH